jgi:hypothetical protein
MALAPGDALVEVTDVAVRVAAAHQTDRVCGFDERPLEVAVDVGAEAPVAPLVDRSRGRGRCTQRSWRASRRWETG